MTAATILNLSLVSHTNAGKTTLARSLLGRDVGEVRDEAHVTALAERHTLLEVDGACLQLWDTPGFGDSARLARRLRQECNPLAWLRSEAWDRWRDRPFWSSQQAMRNVRDEADVVLYLVNATESPRDAGYVAPEMEILAWMDKPVLLLLNQLGAPRPDAQDAADEARWRAHVAAYPCVRGVLSLDAFARCWVQEFTLLAAIAQVLPAAKQAAFAQLRAAWQQQRLTTLAQALDILAETLAGAARDEEIVADTQLMPALKAIVLGRDKEATPREQAMARLAERLTLETRRSTDRLIEIHGLGGRAAAEVLARLADAFAVQARLPEGRAALVGGALSGALSGLAADLAAGGLTLGAGLVGGALLGALGSAGLAHGYNLIRGADASRVRWSSDALSGQFAAALLRYLAVAHYGRGRGEWQQGEHPLHWQSRVDAQLAARQARLATLWRAPADPGLEAELRAELDAAIGAILDELYPGSLQQGKT
jgi:hypothetical protein